MRRTIVTMVALVVAFVPTAAEAATHQAETRPTCDDAAVYVGRLYRALLGREADPEGMAHWLGQLRAGAGRDEVAEDMASTSEHQARSSDLDDRRFVAAAYRDLLGRSPDRASHAYWLRLVEARGRAQVASWMAGGEGLDTAWPYLRPARCDHLSALGLDEVLPGIAIGTPGDGETVAVVAERSMVDYRAVDQDHDHATNVAGDIVVNANWFTPAGPQAPVVVDGRRSGSEDLVERGQVVSYSAGCGEHDGTELTHVWQGEIYDPDECVLTAVSGVSLVHKGQRADSYPGITITAGYTNINTAHSFIGFNNSEIVLIATRSMNASRLADYAISLGVTEGMMLDGGGSTQIKTPTVELTADRTVPTFVVLDHRLDIAP